MPVAGVYQLVMLLVVQHGACYISQWYCGRWAGVAIAGNLAIMGTLDAESTS